MSALNARLRPIPWPDMALGLWGAWCAVETARYFLSDGARARFHLESYLLW